MRICTRILIPDYIQKVGMIFFHFWSVSSQSWRSLFSLASSKIEMSSLQCVLITQKNKRFFWQVLQDIRSTWVNCLQRKQLLRSNFFSVISHRDLLLWLCMLWPTRPLKSNALENDPSRFPALVNRPPCFFLRWPTQQAQNRMWKGLLRLKSLKLRQQICRICLQSVRRASWPLPLSRNHEYSLRCQNQ